MTARAITLSTPADLLAVIPRLLGFEPHASIVVLSLRQRRIGLTQRMDVPGPHDVDPAARTLVRPLLRDEADGALAVGYADQPQQSRPLMDALTALLAEHGVPILDRLVVHAGRWRSLDCTNPGCCPPEGTPLKPPPTASLTSAPGVPGLSTLSLELRQADGPQNYIGDVTWLERDVVKPGEPKDLPAPSAGMLDVQCGFS